MGYIGVEEFAEPERQVTNHNIEKTYLNKTIIIFYIKLNRVKWEQFFGLNGIMG